MSNFRGALINAAYAALMFANVWAAAAAFVATAWQDKEVRRRQRNARNDYNNSLNDRLNLVRATNAPRRRVYGEDLVGGLAYVIGSSGALSEYLHIIVVHAAHECDAILDVYYNDTLVTLDGSGNATSAPYGQTRNDLRGIKQTAWGSNIGGGTTTLDHVPTAGSVVVTWADGGGDNGGAFGTLVSGTHYSLPAGSNVITWLVPSNSYNATIQYTYSQTTSYAKVRKYLGTATQAADADLIAAFPGKWTSAHQGKGLCYTAHTLLYSDDVFPSGIPDIKVRLRGAKLFDPRTSTTAWTDRPALIARDYLLAAKNDGGLGCTTAEVDDASVIAATNICDESVATSATESQTRYAIGLSIEPPFTRAGFQQILDSMGGDAAYVQGKWIIYAGAYQTPTLTLTDADVIDTMDPVVEPSLPDDQVCNEVQGQFIDPAQYWRLTSYPAVKNSTYLAQDNNIPHIEQLTFAGVQDILRVQRLAKQYMDRSRQAMTYQAAFGLKAYKLMPGQTAALTIAENGWSSKVFRVISRSFSVTAGVKLTLREEAAAAYDWNYGQAITFDPAPNTTLRSPFDVPTPGALTIASNDAYLMMMGDGSIISRMRVSWAQATDAAVLNGGRCVLEWWRSDQSAIYAQRLELAGDATQALIGPVADGVIYIVRLQWRNGLIGGKWSSSSHQVVGKTAVPPNATSLTVSTTAALTRRFAIALPATLPLDIAGFVLRSASGNVSTWASMTWFDDGVLTQADAGRTVIVEFDDPPAGTWSFACKLVDTSGNESAAAVYHSNLTLGAQPVDGSRSFNLLKNSHWTEYTGTNTGIAALKDWITFNGGVTDATIYRTRQDGYCVQPGGITMQDSTNIGSGLFWQVYQQTIPCTVGQSYEASFIGTAMRCRFDLLIEFKDAGGNIVGTASDSQNAGSGVIGGASPAQAGLWWCVGVAPAGAVTAGIVARKYATNAGSSDSFAMANYAYLGPAPAGVTRSTRTPWSSGGVTQLHGGGLLDGTVGTNPIEADATTNVFETAVSTYAIPPRWAGVGIDETPGIAAYITITVPSTELHAWKIVVTATAIARLSYTGTGAIQRTSDLWITDAALTASTTVSPTKTIEAYLAGAGAFQSSVTLEKTFTQAPGTTVTYRLSCRGVNNTGLLTDGEMDMNTINMKAECLKR